MNESELGMCPEYLRMGKNRCLYICYLEKQILKGNPGARQVRETRQVNFCGSKNYIDCKVYQEIQEERSKESK